MSRKSPRAVTMKDIARDLGVSSAAVCKALGNAGDISAELKERVRARARELNYQPDLAARSLVTRRTFVVGLVIPDLMHSFFAEIAKGVARQLQPEGYTLVLANSEEDPSTEDREIQQLLARKVDGVIVAAAQSSSHDRFSWTRQHRTALVLIDRNYPGIRADFVGADDELLGRMATEHILAKGCRHIVHVGCPSLATGAGRLAGYRDAMRDAGRPARAIETTNTRRAGCEAVTALLESGEKVDGLFCFSDPVAAGAMEGVLKMGRGIPQDVALIGAGNVEYSDMLRVPLSTVDLGCGWIGEQAAALLMERMSGRAPRMPRTLLAPLRLIERESSSRLTN